MTLPFHLRQTLVPAVSTTRKVYSYPVRRIYCIGQNYESHAREMGGHTSKNNPFFFSKPADAVVTPSLDSVCTRMCGVDTSCAPAREEGGSGGAGCGSKACFLDHLRAETSSMTMRYPSVTESYHYEVELVVAIGPRHSQLAALRAARGSEGQDVPDHILAADAALIPEKDLQYANLPVEEASDVIYAYGVGLDMTRRDMQAQAKEQGKPWDLAKGGDDCAVMSPLILARDLKQTHPHLFISGDIPTYTQGHSNGHAHGSRGGSGEAIAAAAAAEAQSVDTNLDIRSGSIFLSVNGKERQNGNMDCMVNTPAEIIAILSKLVTLRAGDLIFTGTPSGVGPVRRGDVLTAGVEGVGDMTVTVV